MAVLEVEVNVTSDDIILGTRFDDTGCPIALALHRLGLGHARVGCREVALLPGVDVALPADVVRWVQQFDEGEDVWPISFEIKVPGDAMKAEEQDPWGVAAARQLDAVRQWMAPLVADVIAARPPRLQANQRGLGRLAGTKASEKFTR